MMMQAGRFDVIQPDGSLLTCFVEQHPSDPCQWHCEFPDFGHSWTESADSLRHAIEIIKESIQYPTTPTRGA